jgi:hypothetical protein
MLEPAFFARLSIVFMMGFVVLFDRVHWRHKYGWQVANLMTQDESQQILRILAASQEENDSD